MSVEDKRIQQHNLDRARAMRHEQTPAESVLWSRLRSTQLGYKFRRQQPIGPYIADFYCPNCLLVVEVDGDSHSEQAEYDADRTTWLEAQQHKVLRFTNAEVRNNLAAVLEAILRECEARKGSGRYLAVSLALTPALPHLGGERSFDWHW